MLLLFDIDGTLVNTNGAGLTSITDAIREVFGDDGPPLDLAGATDLGLFAKICADFQREPTAELQARFFDAYLARLEVNLTDPCFGGHALEGAHQLLSELNQTDSTLALLTGNCAAGAEVKMSHYEMDHYFPFGAYGDDHADRNELGKFALQRAKLETGKEFSVEETLIIGDTPKDILCAHAIGAKCLAVATGGFTCEQLLAAGADSVLEDFSDTEASLKVLFATLP